MKRIAAFILIAALAACALPAMAQDGYFTSATPIYIASEAQLINISRASDAINGWYVPSGGSFAFNDAVGPRTYEYGYVEAVNGRGVKSVGGGVSQVATTLYLALLQMTGIQYTQITTYGDRFAAGYVSDGALAVVTDYAAAVDFAFINNSGQDITIRCWNDDAYLYCEVGAGDAYGIAAEDSYGQLIGSASFPISANSGLVNNITRAAENADGTVLYTGDEFSFNGIIGPRTGEYGFVSAVNGRGVNVIGGGVAQVASVLWLAVKDMDVMTVTEKSTYGSRYNQDYVAASEDAIATDYNAGTDFAFRYDGSGCVTIRVYVSGGWLYCEIYDGEAEPYYPTPAPWPFWQNFSGLNW